MKLLTVFGTRPECIKLAPVIKEAEARKLTVQICVTGQHREMLRQCLNIFDLEPDYDLAVMQPNQGLSSLTARILDALPGVLQRSRPDVVLVQGDTTTAFAAALASFYAKVSVGHVEAGLRTYDLASPFPEEAMRQMISRLASWHFAPTMRSEEALLREGIRRDRVFVTGNTVIDALVEMTRVIQSGLKPEYLELPSHLVTQLDVCGRMVLITGHRRENFGAGFERVCAALSQLARDFPETLFIYPVHLNPNVRQPAERLLGAIGNIALIPPVNYYTFVYLMNRSHLIISDSGGVQEEAPSVRRPVFVTRDNSERMEAVSSGAVKLVGTDTKTIVENVSAALRDDSVYNRMIVDVNPYGDGHAAERILDCLAGEE